MDKKMFVGNLPWSATEEDLNQLFSRFGTVESVEVLRDKFTNRARGFGFVTMSTAEQATAAVAGTEGQDFQGRPLKVNVARPREEGGERRPSFDRPREGGFGGGQGGGYQGGAPRSGGYQGGGQGGGYQGGAPRSGGYQGGGQGGERRSFGGPREGGSGGYQGGGGGSRSGGFGGGSGGYGR